ncbi:MAG: MFS transporter [Acidobacteriota bacterium]
MGTRGGLRLSDKKLSLKKLWVLMVTAFVDMIGFALLLPLLPLYAQRFGADAFTVGLLMASFALAQLVCAPLWGRLSDRVGRRPVILGSLSLAALAFLFFAYAESVLMLLVCRLLQGAGGANMSVVSAYVSDSVGPEERAKGLGWITACTSAGVMIGPAIGTLAIGAGWGLESPGLIAAVLCVLNILFAWRWLPESSAEAVPAEPRKPQRIREQIHTVLRHPMLPTSSLIWIYASGMMAFMAMNGVLALYLAYRFEVDESNIGWYYVAVGMVSVVIRGLVLGWIVRRYGEVRVLRRGALLLGAGMILAPFAATPWQFLLIALLIPTGTAFLFPSTTSLISRYADPREVGQTLGVQQAFGGVSRLLGPIWAGAVFQHIGESVPFRIGGGLVLLTALFALRLHPGEAPRKPAPATDSEAAVG